MKALRTGLTGVRSIVAGIEPRKFVWRGNQNA